ncbi:hypothetical protein RBJ45_00670 [Escherichia coli]|nr:hypothetical protein [Escherichia coli]MDT0796586.1 hypothetical protein [Escherichia coli]MDT0860122.1 hypothetical protein [Escherichia coli]
MSQKYLIRIAELERLLSEQAEALRQKDQQLSLVEDAYFHERRSLNNFHRDRVITFEQIAE